MRHFYAGLIFGICSLASIAHAADTVHPGLEQDERQCERATMPLAECVQQLMVQGAVSTGDGTITAQSATAYIQTDETLGPYFAWLSAYARRLPRSGSRRSWMLHVVRDRTSHAFEDLLYRSSQQSSKVLISLLQQVKADSQQIAQLKQALTDRSQREKDAQERLKLDWFKALSAAGCSTSMPAPNVTCTSQHLGDGTTTTTCN